MPGIIEYPKLVQDALARYADLFANECQRRHFAEYLTGLFVAERKTVLGIHGEFARTTDQSCLNRFLTAADWDAQDLNQRRLDELQKDPSTRYSDQGVIPIDNTLVDRDGMLIPDAGWYWDHAEERNKIAQDYLFVNYVCTSGKHYPLEFRLFRKQEICEALGEPFHNHTALCCELLVTNRITWEVSRIVRVYRYRWTGTETFHRDGKQQLGLGDCQLRDVQGQTRHMYLVMLAYSLLVGELKQGRAKEWALHRLMTIGEACRGMAKEALRTTLAWAIEQVTRFERPYDHVVAQLGLS